MHTDRKDLGTVIRSDKDAASDSVSSSHNRSHGRRRVLVSAGSTMLLLAAGCSSSSNSTGSSGASTAAATSSSAAAADTIVIQNFAFSPATLTVAPGTTVTVVNKDAVTHTVTSTAATRAFSTPATWPPARAPPSTRRPPRAPTATSARSTLTCTAPSPSAECYRRFLRFGRRGRTKASSAPTAARMWAVPRRVRSPAHHQESCPSTSRGCMPMPCSAHTGHACHRRSVTVSCAASATTASACAASSAESGYRRARGG